MPVSGIKKVKVRCEVCGSAEASIVAEGKDFEYDNTTDDAFTFVRCGRCGHLYLDPRPDISELQVIYPPDYHAYKPPTDDKSLAARLIGSGLALRYRAEKGRIRGLFSRYFDVNTPLRIIDIGCAFGHKLEMFHDINGNFELWGVEIDKESAEHAKKAGFHVYDGRFEDVDFPEGYFDFIYCSNVIEHVESPARFMEKINRISKPGGILLLETPTNECLDFRIFRGRYWGAYHFPRHWNIFNTGSFGMLAEKMGFDIIGKTFLPCPTHWIWSIHHVLKEKNIPGPVVRFFSMNNIVLLIFFGFIDAGLIRIGKGASTMQIAARKKR